MRGGRGESCHLCSPCRLSPRRCLAPTTTCSSPSEPTSWTTRLTPRVPAPTQDTSQSTGPAPFSVLAPPHTHTPPQAHGPFPLCPQDLFSKSDPFIEIYKTNEDQSEQLVWRTEVGALSCGERGRRSRVGKPRQWVTGSLVPLRGGEEQPEPQLGAIPPVPALPVQL